MTSQKETKSIPILEEKDMENVELHRAESMVKEQIEILEQLKYDKKGDQTTSVFLYVGNKVRSITSGMPQITVELVMFLYMFSYIMRSVTSTTMIMNKVCLIHLGYSEETCNNLKEFPTIKSEVEKMANNYHLGHSLLQLMPSAFLALFIGSWSDKYGRKFPIILSLVGIIIDGFGTIICAHYLYSRVEFYYIPAIFTGFSGGFVGVLMVLYSYASDVTSAGKRTMKYALMEMAFGISMPLGSLAGGWLFKFYGYVPVFMTSTCGHILGLFCVIFFLEETRGLDNKDNWFKKFQNFWSLNSVVNSFRTTAKKRPNKGTEQIWLLILGMSIAIFSFASLSGISFFYVYHRYNWENTTYSTISAVYQVIGLTLMIIIVPLSKKWNIGDPLLGIVGSVSLMLKNIGMGIASKTWIFHVANFVGLLNNLGSLAGRSRISKLVSKDDLGKVFAFLTTAESILPIAATAIVSQVFNATLDIFPGLIFVVMGVLIIIPLSVFTWIFTLPALNYEEMEEGLPQNNDQVNVETKEKGESSSEKY